MEPLVGHASPEHDLFSARRDPAGDPLVETLAATQTDLAREAHGCPQPELVPLDEHDRRGPGPHSARHLGRCARQDRAGVASVHQTLTDPAEHVQALVQLGGAALRTDQVSAVGRHHREQLRGGRRRDDVEGVERHLAPQRDEHRGPVPGLDRRDHREGGFLAPPSGWNRHRERAPCCASEGVLAEDRVPIGILDPM